MALGSIADVTEGFGGAGGTFGLLGLGLGAYSSIEEANIQKQEAGLSETMASDEMAVNQQRQLQMNMFGQRQMMENYRNTQRTRAMGMAAAVNSGAQYGSGIAGAQGGEAAQGGLNTRSINQNLQIGNQIFSLNNQIGQSEIQMAGLQGQASTYAGMGSIAGGLSSFGSGLMGGAQNFGNIFGS